MATLVKITAFPIETKGQWHFFQVRMPVDTVKIIGIETSVSIVETDLGTLPSTLQTDWLSLYRHIRVGEIKLQSLDETGFFYAGEIVETDRNLFRGDYSFTYYGLRTINPGTSAEEQVPEYTNPINFWQSKPWTHSGCRFEDEIMLSGQKIINGFYHDSIGETLDQDTHYTISLYTWYETN
jgi:hypothetical protein